MNPPRPNIIFIQSDSFDGRWLGRLGHPATRRATPNLDRLARRGVVFRNAYANNAICVPSRASMWTGKYTHHCEGWNNYKGLDPTTPTFQQPLEKAGYVYQTFGKTGYLSGGHTQRARVSAWTREANIRRPSYNEEAPRIIEDETERVCVKDWDTIDQSLAWLAQDRPKDSPFLLYVGLNLPHPPFVTSRRYLSQIDENEVDLPGLDEELHPVMEYQRICKGWRHGFSREMIRLVRRVYLGMIAETDAVAGRLLDGLKALNLLDDACILFSSDHGELAMEHQQFYKMNLYEPCIRVPLIVAGPGLSRGKSVEEPVSLVDVYPTLVEMAGAKNPSGLDGHSLLPEAAGRKSGRPDWVFAEYHDTTCNTGSFMVRRGDWKYIAFPGFKPMLFNLREDPGELRNLADRRPEQAQKMEALLRSIVDYEAVDAKVKAYCKDAFRRWREERLAEGSYGKDMARIFSGWGNLKEDEIRPWTDEDEKQIQRWLLSRDRVCRSNLPHPGSGP